MSERSEHASEACERAIRRIKRLSARVPQAAGERWACDNRSEVAA